MNDMIDSIVKKSPLRNAILAKYSNFQKSAKFDSIVTTVKFLEASTDTSDLNPSPSLGQQELLTKESTSLKSKKVPVKMNSSELMKLASNFSVENEYLETVISTAMKEVPAEVLAYCSLVRSEMVILAQKTIDLQNQVKFFKGLVKGKK